MSDHLDALPEGNSGDDPMMDVYFEKPKSTKKTWREFMKILAVGILSFCLAANPITGLFLSKVGIFRGAYQNFFGQVILFFLVFALTLWYF